MTTINVTEAEPQDWRTVLFNDVPWLFSSKLSLFHLIIFDILSTVYILILIVDFKASTFLQKNPGQVFNLSIHPGFLRC